MGMDGPILVLGLGNTLLSDDGIGVHAVQALETRTNGMAGVVCREGGTLGISLLPEIEDAGALIVIDAAEIGEAPGTIRTFLGTDMDAQLGGKKHSVHEVALADLMSAAGLNGTKPARRALIGIQPATTSWGLESSPALANAVREACETALQLIEKWSAESGSDAQHCGPQNRTGMIEPVVREIAAMLEKLARDGVEGAIDLRGLPLTDADRAELETLLARGEVHAQINVAGRSEIWETGYAGVWWIRHFGADGRVASETVSVTSIPDILKSDPADVARAAGLLKDDLSDTDRTLPQLANEEASHG